MKFPMPREYKYIRPIDNVSYGKSHFKKGLIVPEISVKYGSILSKIKTMPFYSKYLIGSIRELGRSVRSIENNPYTGKTTLNEKDLKDLNDYILSLGISNIGYTRLGEEHMFSQSIVLFKNAIVLTMEMKESEIKLAPSIPTIKEIFRTYYELGRAVNLISEFLRSRGYNAQAVGAISSNLNLALMARDAGLGGFGKNGLLITKDYGPSVRLAAVLTDIDNLPFSDTKEFEWIKDFCESCNACVRKCPAGAIYEKSKILDDSSEEHIDYKKCALPFSKDNGCTICIKECSFFKGDYNSIKNAYIKKGHKE